MVIEYWEEWRGKNGVEGKKRGMGKGKSVKGGKSKDASERQEKSNDEVYKPNGASQKCSFTLSTHAFLYNLYLVCRTSSKTFPRFDPRVDSQM